MREIIASLTILWCSATYWLGGQELPWFKRGFKWIRRYVMPLGLLVGLYLLKPILLPELIACLLLSAALHVGYGSKLYKMFLSGLLMGLPVLILSMNWICLFPAISHGGLGALSLKDNKFVWAIVAVIQGMVIGIVYVYAVL